jgi:zinc transport system ATP-binding protein
MSEALIEISALHTRVGGRRLLRIDRLQIDRGEVVAIVGPNGAGKSTLIRAIVGLQRGLSGDVNTLGVDVVRATGRERTALRRRLGYVPQAPAVGGELPLTAREVVEVGRSGRRGLLRRLDATDATAVESWMNELDVAHLGRQLYTALSGGEQRRVMLARALCAESELLILDEPTANLDLGARERMVDTIDRLHRERGTTVLMVCHELDVIPPSCRRVLLLDRGELIDDGDPSNVLTGPRVSTLYRAPLDVVHRGGRHVVVPGTGDVS